MPSATLNINASIGSLPLNSSQILTAQGEVALDTKPEPIPAAKAGTLTVRTDADEGTLTLGAGHGIVDADKIAIYWPAGRRYGVTVGVVAGNAVPFSGGAGDDLPDADTELTCQVEQPRNVDFAGDDIVVLGMLCDQRCHVTLLSAAPASVLELDLAAGVPYWWQDDGVTANPLAGDTVASLTVTQDNAEKTARLRLGALVNA